MLGLAVIALAVALIGTVAATVEGYKAWGAPALLILPIGFGVTILPYGSYLAAFASIVVFQRARTARFRRLAEPDALDDDVADVFE